MAGPIPAREEAWGRLWNEWTEGVYGQERKDTSRMATGTVKWFNDEKGYGFIRPDEGDRDLFVHHTAINGTGFKTLQENSKVSYDEEVGDKGPKAVNVTKI